MGANGVYAICGVISVWWFGDVDVEFVPAGDCFL